MKTTKKKAATKPLPVKEQLHELRRKVWLLQKYLAGEAAGLEFANACGVTGRQTEEHRDIEAAALRRCTHELDRILRVEV